MKRSSPLTRTTGLSRTTRLRRRSERMQQVYEEERIPLVQDLLRARPWCEMRVFCDGAPSVDVHEILTRGRRGSITDPRNCLTACRRCHDWVTTHPRQANCLGLTVPSWAENYTADPWALAAELRATRAPCPWGPGPTCDSTCERQRVACDAVMEGR